jgi:hypothetical protein
MAEPTPPQRLAESVLERGFIEKDLPNWESFQEELQILRTKYDKANSPILFRGQNDSEFRLTTTLERAGCEGMSFDSYYRLAVGRVRPAVETFTGVKWDVPNYNVKMEQEFSSNVELFSFRLFPGVELYRYLVYLRHHGFPSPLLDWSCSPYVAAFFAFRNLLSRPPEGKPEKCSIYAYCETPEGSKGGAVGAPAIRSIGPYVRSHPRHFRQQSDYTLCGAFDRKLGWKFHLHEDVFGSRGARQDVLWKFNLPSSESSRVLHVMDEYNLNAFSLYDSQEALLETMWCREHALGS